MRLHFAPLFIVFGLSACGSPSATSLSTLPSARSAAVNQFLYVASAKGGVSVYQLGSTVPTRTLSADLPTAMVFDRTGNLYVANHSGGPSGRGYVSVFAPGSDTPARKISNGINVPYSLALDSKGNLYVANYIRSLEAPKTNNGSVTVYKPNTNTPYRTINGVNHPHQIAIDSKDDLVVAEALYLRVYTPGATSALTLARYPFAMVIDSKDRIYAGLWGECPNYCFGGIAVYAPGKKVSIAGFDFDGAEDPATNVTGLAFDSLGDFVFSATNGPRNPFGGPPRYGGGAPVWPGAVGVYPTLRHHGGRHRYWITTSYDLAPSAIVVDPANNIIVGGNGSVDSFPDFQPDGPPLYTITQGISGQVTALAIASQ